MELLLSGVDRTLIALWLGHESVETTQIYLDANLAIKEEILAKTITPSRLCRIGLIVSVLQLNAKCRCFILDSA